MRRLGSLALSLVLTFTGAARAEDQSDLARLAERYGADAHVVGVRRPVVNGPRAGAARAAATEVIGHQIQTLVLMMIITGVEIVRSNVEIARLKRDDVSPAEIARLSGEAAEQILGGGGTWAGIVGMGVAGRVARRPLALLNAYLDNAVTRPLLKTLITSGITSFITFAGWEVGGQLWDEARELIQDDADYERADHLAAALFGAALNADDRRVLGLMFSNMFQIVVADHELRSLWLYNAWRMRIATGQFATLVTSMVSAGAVGTALFPGAGTVAGLGFGAVGGVVTLFVPESFTTRVTDRIAVARVRYGETRLAQALDQLDEANTSIRSGVAGLSPYVRAETGRLFAVVNDALDDALSARFEIIYRLHARANVLTGNRRIAADPAEQGRLDLELLRVGFRLHVALDEAAASVEAQARRVGAVFPGGPDGELRQEYQRELIELGRIATALKRVAAAPEDDRARSILINKIYLVGFKARYLN